MSNNKPHTNLFEALVYANTQNASEYYSNAGDNINKYFIVYKNDSAMF